MLYINPKGRNILFAKKHFKTEMEGLLMGRILNVEKKYGTDAIKIFDKLVMPFFEDLIKGNPTTLISISKYLNPFLNEYSILEMAIKYVYNYDWFIAKQKRRYGAVSLASDLDISVCPYCNRSYTKTIFTKKGKNLLRPQFDHYFDKASHPALALSFFNLIPSCSDCNTVVKKSKIFELRSHSHPYVDNDVSNYYFSFSFSDKAMNGIEVDLKFTGVNKSKKTLSDLAIESIYNSHSDIVYDLLKIKSSYSDKYLSILGKSTLKGTGVTQEELYRLAFGTEINSANFIKLPFSKLKSDILKELGII